KTLASFFERMSMKIGGKYLDLRGNVAVRRLFVQQHGQRIRLLSGGASHRPHPHELVGALLVKEFGNHFFLEFLEDFGIAKEAGDCDQQIVPEGADLFRMLSKPVEVELEVLDIVDLHPPGDAAQNRRSLVAAEVAIGAGPQVCKHSLEENPL